MLRLKEYRIARGWTQAELSRKSGVSRSYISELEHNSYNVTVYMLCKLCKGFDCSPNELINERYWK